MNLLFDLDGTLTDPAEGITACIQHSLQALGQGNVPMKSDLRRFIGPPLQETFAELLRTSDEAWIDDAIARYRERFSVTGLFENELYAETLEGLACFQGAGHRLWVATSKPEVFAERIIDHFELTRFFQKVYGSELDGRNSAKTDLIAHVLLAEGLDPGQTCMIGDRSHDIVGGRANGVRTIGVLWGFGSEDELRMAKAEFVVDSVLSLRATIETLARSSNSSASST